MTPPPAASAKPAEKDPVVTEEQQPGTQTVAENKLAEVADPGDEQPEPAEAPAKKVEAAEELTGRDLALASLRKAFFADAEANKPVEIKPTKEVSEWLTKNGIDPTDVVKVSDYKTQIATLSKEAQEGAAVKELIEKLPRDLQVMIDKAARGQEDWKKIATKPAVDYSRPFEQHDVKKMVSAFLPGQISEGDWEEWGKAGEGDPNVVSKVKLAIELTKRDYSAEKSTFDNHFVQQQESDRQWQKRMGESRRASIAHLVKETPGIEALLPEIEQGLTREGIEAMFFEPDGTLKLPAARSYARLKYEAQLSEKRAIEQKVKAKNDAKAEVMGRTPERMAPSTKSAAQPGNQKLTPEQQAQLMVQQMFRPSLGRR